MISESRILLFSLATILAFAETACAQEKSLRPSSYGSHLVHYDVPKDTLLASVVGASNDEKSDLIRFDNAGAGSGDFKPMVISEVPVSAKDSLGVFSLCFQKDTLNKLFDILLSIKDKVYTRPPLQYSLFRITYRRHSATGQFYITDLTISTNAFKEIEKLLINTGKNRRPNDIVKFYRFLGPSEILKYSKDGKDKWKY